MNEIRSEQQNTELYFLKNKFKNLCKEILREVDPQYHIRAPAALAIQNATESFFVELFELSNYLAINSDRHEIVPEDMRTALHIKKVKDIEYMIRVQEERKASPAELDNVKPTDAVKPAPADSSEPQRLLRSRSVSMNPDALPSKLPSKKDDGSDSGCDFGGGSDSGSDFEISQSRPRARPRALPGWGGKQLFQQPNFKRIAEEDLDLDDRDAKKIKFDQLEPIKETPLQLPHTETQQTKKEEEGESFGVGFKFDWGPKAWF
uniref:Core Histone H2A/H2B/H3 domain-containing protein n=1 Tax=Arcella intermedia TaxID=1963864 RepID=A0A6B2LEA5_9EUKA